MKSLSLLAAAAAASFFAVSAQAVQYNFLAPGYTQEIYTGPLKGGPGMAWTTTNHLLTRNGSTILEYSPTQDITYKGTALHSSINSYTIPGLVSSGFGMTTGLDGNIYTVTGIGLQRFNQNLAGSASTLPGSIGGAGYGITTLPDGRIAYSDGAGISTVYIYDPVAFTNTPIYTSNGLIDGIVAGPNGNLALAGQSAAQIEVITNTGSLITTIATAHFPDGLAFASNPSSSTLYSNNNDGSITRYAFSGPNFTGTMTATDIATQPVGNRAYGDLASVGPDCAFYVSQFDNGNYHGANSGIGTHWDDLTTSNEASIVRIGMTQVNADGTVSPCCEFYSPLATSVPVPAAIWTGLVALGGIAVARLRRKSA